ncbi:MAG: TetR/AcrR family transcriptional regulator [Eubacterium sp.]|nr:TetR/AcrR family transcriptional regulator [Eubacterium sp.]
MSEYKAARSRTRQKIEAAFWKLYLEKDFHRVTVREIVQEAGIHRSTFYQYYESVGDIFDGIKEHQLFLLKETCQITEKDRLSHDSHTYLLAALQKLFDENRLYLKPLLVDYHSSSFSLEYRQILKDNLKKDIGFREYTPDSDAWFMLDTLTSGMVEMLFHFLDEKRFDIQDTYPLSYAMIEAARTILNRDFRIY